MMRGVKKARPARRAAKPSEARKQSPRLPNGLTTKQDNFARGLALHGNSARAYIEAGYKPQRTSQANAHVACRLLQENPKIFSALNEYRRGYAETIDVRTDNILANYGAIGTADPADFVDEDGAILQLKDMPARARLAIQQLTTEDVLLQAGDDEHPRIIKRTTKLRFHPKVPALDALARIKGLGVTGNRGLQPRHGRPNRA